MSIQEKYKKALDIYLNHRRDNPDFTFAVRQQDTIDKATGKKRLSELHYYFQGRDDYIFTSPYKPGDNSNKTKRIGFVLNIRNNNCSIELAIRTPQVEYIEFYKRVLEEVLELEYEGIRNNVYKKTLGSLDKWETELSLFLNDTVPIINKIAKTEGVPDEHLFFTEKEFQKNIDRITKAKENTTSQLKDDTPSLNEEPKLMTETQLLLNSEKKQLILQGAPGTGKTYRAKKIRDEILGHPTFEELIQQEVVDSNIEDEREPFSKIIQFHPSYSYEDFVRGICVSSDDGKIVYNTENKVLAEMAQEAKDDPDNNYVLIIDEINRANLPAVLGELIYALEYRGEVVESMYEYEGSREIILPKNLYIIGTMNTTDRSLSHIDYAIRRRFLFVTIEADIDVISDERFSNSINCFKKVEELFGDKHLSPEFKKSEVMIGHSYFLTNDIDSALEYEIKPILMEYIKDGILIDSGDDKIISKVENLTSD